MASLPETPSGWLGSSERSEALKLSATRGLAARATGLMNGIIDADLRASFERTTRQVARFLNVPVGLFSLLDGECQAIVAGTGYPGPAELPAEGSMCVHVRDSGRDLIIDDLTRHELGDVATNMTSAGAQSYLGTPVLSPRGEPIGSLCAIDLSSRSWEPGDLDLLRALAEGLTDKIALLESLARAEASEARLSAMIDTIPNAVFVFEPDGRIGYASPLVLEQFGIEPEQLVGFGYLRHLHPDDAARMQAGMRERAGAPSAFEQEFRLRDTRGEYRELVASGTPFRDADGTTGYVVSTTDVGYLRKSERELEIERARLTGVMEALPHIVVLSSPESGVDYVSPQVLTILGHTPEATLGFGFYENILHPDDRAALHSRRLEFLGKPEPFEYEFRARHTDGRIIPMLLRGFPLPPMPGMTHTHVSTFTEISAIRAAEERAAEESRRLQGVLDVLPAGLMLVDESGKVVLSNDEAAKLFGLRFRDGFANTVWPEVWFVEADGTETAMDDTSTPIYRALQGEAVRDDRLIRIVAEDGGERFIKCDAETLRDPRGGVEGAVMVTSDITELRRAETQVQVERRESDERLRTIFDAMPILTALIDLEGRIQHVNETALRAAGLTTSGVIGVVAWETPFVAGNPEAASALRDVIERGLAGEHVQTTIEFRFQETKFQTIYYAVPILDANGAVASLSVSAVDVTEIHSARERLERERLAATDRMQAMLDGMPIWVGLVAPDGRLLGVNRAPVEAAGKTIEGVLGTIVWEEWTNGDLETTQMLREIITAAASGERVTREITYRWNGQEIETEYHAVPLRDADGRVTMIATSALDVTERNVSRRRVEAEGELLSRVLNNMPILASLTDPEGRILYLNDTALRPFGLTIEGVRGLPIWDVVRVMGEGFDDVFRRGYERCLRGESVREEFEVTVVGGTMEVEHRMDALRGEDGTILSILSTAVDVTERKQALREADEERVRLRTILEVLPAGLLIADAEGRIVDGNTEGWSLVSASGQSNPDDFEWPTAWYQEFDGTETLIGPGEGPMPEALLGISVRELRTIRMVGHDGTIRFIKCDAEPLLSSDGEVVGAIMTILDVTDLHAAQDEANRAKLDSFARMQRVIDSLPINVVLADPEGRLLYANETPLKAAGLKLDEILGQIAWESPWMPNEETAQITKEEYMKAAGGEIARREFSIQLGDVTAEVDHTVVPIFDANGRVEFLLPSSIDVTARNQALREVDAERRRLSQTVEGMPVGLFVFDREMKLLDANVEAMHATGLTPDRLASGYVPTMWFIEPDGTETPCPHEEAPSWRALKGLDGRETRPIRLHHPGTDPSEDLYVHLEAAPLTNAHGEIEGAIVTAVDVKPLLEAEKALAREKAANAAAVEEERRRLRQIVDNLPIGLFVFDKGRRIIQSNEEGLSAFGLSLDQMKRGDFAEAHFIEPDGSETYADVEHAPLRRVLRGESGREPRVMRLRYPGADPLEDRFVRAEAAALTDAAGEIEGAVFTVVNVKPLREAELALAQEREAATERLTATLEGVSAFISLLDLEGRIVWCNQAMLLVAGFTFADIENARFEESVWFTHDSEMQRRVAEATAKAAIGEMSFTPVSAIRVGGLMDVDLTLAPIRGEDGAVKYIVASGIEVTSRNAAMREIEDARMSAERAREIAERATRAKDEFLAVLSHELRTPLTPAMLGLELLGGDLDEILPGTKDPELAASIQETMGTVRSNLEIQVRLIDDLLDVTRIARGKLELRKTQVDVHDAARHAISIVASRAADKGITITLDPGAQRSLVAADPARLRQIFWNLLANAVKFTDLGGTIQVVSEAAGPGTVRLKVIDDGLGIEPERLATIFDAFDQGDGTVSRGFGGLGLGLAIARSLARAHGGTLWATSLGKGSGATFVLELPTVEVEDDSMERAAQRQLRDSHEGCRILLIEDNLDTAKFSAALLRRTKIEVEVAHSVAEAAKLGAEGRWNAILTDIGLPDGDGVEAVNRLRALGVQAPAIAMSGYGRDEDKARTSDAGFRAHLVKPIVFERLLEVLDEILPESCD